MTSKEYEKPLIGCDKEFYTQGGHTMQLEPRKRTALDGRVWWCVRDTKKHEWGTLPCFGKYKRKRDAQYAIDKFNRFCIERIF